MSDIIKILKKVKAILTDSHFVLTSGRHSSAYINKDMLYPHTKETSQVGKMIAEKIAGKKPDVIVGPALGGIILSQWTAFHLSKILKKEILGIYTEKNSESNQVFTRGYSSFITNKRVVVVEDLTATGGSAKKVVNSVIAHKGKVVAVCVMVNRDPELVSSKTIGAPFCCLDVFKIDSYDEKSCPLCKNKIPINITVGHGKKIFGE